MARKKKTRLVPGQTKTASQKAKEKSSEMDAFVQSSVVQLPGIKAATSPVSEGEDSQLEEKSTRKQNKNASEEAPTRKAGFTLPIPTIQLLRDEVHALKSIYDTDGPDRNHLVDLALRRLSRDLQGGEREEIIEELLALRHETKERQKPKSRS
tara:strand:- start:192 stop:650 length:459 start_codon:yes stop_codon:yes gene_type:complete